MSPFRTSLAPAPPALILAASLALHSRSGSWFEEVSFGHSGGLVELIAGNHCLIVGRPPVGQQGGLFHKPHLPDQAPERPWTIYLTGDCLLVTFPWWVVSRVGLSSLTGSLVW